MPNNTYDWKVEIRQQPATDLREIWIYRRRMDNKTEVVQSDTDTINTYDITKDDIKPTLKLPYDIFAALVDAIHGYKPTEGKFTEGKLEAMSEHLKDLRKLLKL